MIRSRAVRYLLCLGLCLVMLGGLAGNHVALAAQESSSDSFSLLPNQEPPPPDEIELSCKYPALRGESGHIFEFSFELTYKGAKERFFDLAIETPPRWTVFIMERYGGTEEIAALQMKSFETAPTGLKVMFGPIAGYKPEPGEYVLTLTAVSEEVKGTLELKAVVTARYGFRMFTETGRLSTEAKAGEDNHLSILVVNRGTAEVEDMTFSSSNPEGWTITFTPDQIDSLGVGLTQEVDVVITPPSKAVAGDYYPIVLRAEGKPELSEKLELRVTVPVSGAYDWVGALIVVVVIAGLGVLFWRLGRR